MSYPCGHYDQHVAEINRVKKSDEAESRLFDAGIMGVYKHATLDTFEPGNGTEVALQAAKDFVESPGGRGYGMVMYSQMNGAGKTHLARAILHEVVVAGSTGYWTRHCDMNHDNRRAYHRAGVLVVDDMWKRATKASAELLYDVLDLRAARRVPTVITTNVTQRQAELVVGDEHGHVISGVYSRLSQMKVVEMNAADYRPKLSNNRGNR